jgi:hypothetical protein
MSRGSSPNLSIGIALKFEDALAENRHDQHRAAYREEKRAEPGIPWTRAVEKP